MSDSLKMSPCDDVPMRSTKFDEQGRVVAREYQNCEPPSIICDCQKAEHGTSGCLGDATNPDTLCGECRAGRHYEVLE